MGAMEPAGSAEADVILDWARGDAFGIEIPSRPESLREGGEGWLTLAFRAAGVLAPDNGVRRITRLEECPGGSTGRKQFLSVEYERNELGLQSDLFVKFSRDFADEMRDRGRDQLEAEVRFALLSRTPGFPIAVPRCYFADYHAASGTGLLITERIAYGVDVEPHHDKCLDYRLDEPLSYYQALVTALAQLAGAHKGGGLPEYVDQAFSFDLAQALGQDRIRYSAAQLQSRVARFGDFSAKFPRLFPSYITSPRFLARLAEVIPQVLQQEDAIKRYLNSDPKLRALCHWNANIDNAWFWRDEAGVRRCGLMDWGRVGQMNVASALAGALMGASPDLWDDHLDELLELFAAQFAAAGGPAIDPRELKLHLCLSVATTGLAWLMDAPAVIRATLPHLPQTATPRDAQIEADETARTQVHMVTVFLNLLERHDLGMLLEEMARRAPTHPDSHPGNGGVHLGEQ